MSIGTDTRAHAFWLLRNEIYEHLDGAEYVAMKPDGWRDEDAVAARKLICDLVTMIRLLVTQHGEDEVGRCRFCRSASWPCRSVRVIHQVLKDPDREFVRHLDDGLPGATS